MNRKRAYQITTPAPSFKHVSGRRLMNRKTPTQVSSHKEDHHDKDRTKAAELSKERLGHTEEAKTAKKKRFQSNIGRIKRLFSGQMLYRCSVLRVSLDAAVVLDAVSLD
ncbi:unnamed protein product [Arabis nemorensis]|uniref:Uncharacterized protein n=1 Tax=Arabis nemorensis TaxID=586526 RepID=A0A565AZN0_9BRAS|nr:unnamed protein product [Arabis nemorensis]